MMTNNKGKEIYNRQQVKQNDQINLVDRTHFFYPEIRKKTLESLSVDHKYEQMNRSIDSDIFYFVMYRGYTIYHAR
jgi:hypothetical protein